MGQATRVFDKPLSLPVAGLTGPLASIFTATQPWYSSPRQGLGPFCSATIDKFIK